MVKFWKNCEFGQTFESIWFFRKFRKISILVLIFEKFRFFVKFSKKIWFRWIFRNIFDFVHPILLKSSKNSDLSKIFEKIQFWSYHRKFRFWSIFPKFRFWSNFRKISILVKFSKISILVFSKNNSILVKISEKIVRIWSKFRKISKNFKFSQIYEKLRF